MDEAHLTMWERQVRKGLVEFALLAMLAAERLYSPEVVKRSAELGLRLPAGTVYPVLSRLRKEGLLEASVEESSQGPPRKYYRLTGQGEALLAAMAPVIADLIPSLRQLLDIIAKDDPCA
jgi:PadR family transcriptional regulator, regulatory protein PadR